MFRFAPQSRHSPAQSGRHSGVNGRSSTTVSRSSGSRSIRSASRRAGLVVVGFLVGIEVELLEIDLLIVGDLLQAACTLPLQLNHGGSGDQHPLHHRLEPKLQIDGGTGWYPDHVHANACRSLGDPLDRLHGTDPSSELMGVEDEPGARIWMAIHSHDRRNTLPGASGRRQSTGVAARRYSGSVRLPEYRWRCAIQVACRTGHPAALSFPAHAGRSGSPTGSAWSGSATASSAGRPPWRRS